MWGHTRFGMDMLAMRTLPSIDPYSFTQDVPWVNHEWLSELAMGAAFEAAGPRGLVVLRTVLVGTALALFVKAYLSVPPHLTAAAVLLWIWGTYFMTATLRPQLWTLLAVTILCTTLVKPPTRSWLLGLPLLFVVWVNAHGGWIVGAGLLGVWTAFQMLRPQNGRVLPAAIAGLSALATLINPYGFQMWGFLAGTVRFSRDNYEWLPLMTLPWFSWMPLVLVLLLVVACVLSRHRPPIDRLVMIGMLAFAAFRVNRIAPLAVVASLLMLRPSLAAWSVKPARRMKALSRNEMRAVLFIIPVIAMASAFAFVKVAECIPIAGDWIPDRAAGRSLAEARLDGRMVTWFDWGEYALWHLGPAVKVSMDGRRETIYSDTMRAQHLELYAGTPRGVAYLQQLNPDYVWLPARMIGVRDWLATRGYRLDISTAESFVAARADRPVLQLRDATVPACFPGP